MKEISHEILDLIEQYGPDTKTALTEHPKVEYMYALSDIRENVLEWYPFLPEGSLLQVGADYGALTGLYSRRLSRVTVLDTEEEELEIVKRRYAQADNIDYACGTVETLWQQAEETKDLGGQAVRYDYVVMLGSLAMPYSETIANAKRLLKPGGRLIVSVCNQFGLKYWAGVKKDDNSFSRDDIAFLMTRDDIQSGKDGQLSWYYPMPDYKLATTVYSGDYLPKKGDLTFMLTAYDYPKYILMNVGAAFDTVCEDGQFENFANSFLIIWSDYAGN